jgi:hypothetical protein
MTKPRSLKAKAYAMFRHVEEENIRLRFELQEARNEIRKERRRADDFADTLSVERNIMKQYEIRLAKLGQYNGVET